MLMSNLQKIAASSVMGVVLIGCSETVQSVDWYLENSDERTTRLENCQTIFNTNQDDPNCANALSAALIASAGSIRTLENW